MCEELVLSTHYADDVSPSKTAREGKIIFNKKTYKGKIYNEDPDFNPHDGLQKHSFWPFEEDLMNMIIDAGFTKIKVLLRNPNHDEIFKLIYLVAKK